jgi:hypothetical protein
VNFAVTGNATAFGSTSVKVNGGKCALLIRSTTTPGPITVTASAAGFSNVSTQITSVADTYNPDDYQFLTPVILQTISPRVKNLSFVQTGTMLRIQTPSISLKARTISILNIKGQNLAVPIIAGDGELRVDTRGLACGSYILYVKNVLNSKVYSRQFFISQ